MVSGGYPPEGKGGGEQQCRKLSRELAERGHQVTVVTTARTNKSSGESMDGLVRVVRFWAPSGAQALGRSTPSALRWAWSFARWWKRDDELADVIHCHQAKFPAVVAGLLASRRSVPVVAKIGDSGRKFDLATLGRKRYVGSWLKATAIRRVHLFVAITDEMEDDLRLVGVEASRIRRIPNGVELSRRASTGERKAARDSLSLPQDKTVAVFAGRLAPEKNLVALAQAASTHDDLVLVVVGSGAMQPELERLGIQNLVLRPPVDDVTPYLLAADYMALASTEEGLSNLLLEALAVGTVPLVSPVGGNTEVIDDGETGLVADSCDASSLSEALARACAMDATEWSRLSRAGRELAEARYAIGSVADAYESLYASINRGARMTDD